MKARNNRGSIDIDGLSLVFIVGLVVFGVIAVSSMHNKQESAKETAHACTEAYSKAVEQRAKVTIELAKEGKTPEEISEYLNEALPLPEAPSTTDTD